MKINYDKIADAIYLNMKVGKIQKTIKINDRLLVDIDKKGGIVGIEMLDVSSGQNAKFLEKNLLSGVPIQIISGTPVLA
jgi:uncharacterized protein YuzE